MRKTFSLARCAAVILICTGLISTGILWYVHQLSNKLEEATILVLKEFASQDVQHVEMQIKEDLELISSIATSLSLLPNPTEQELTRFLHSEQRQNHYKNMEFVWPDGNARLDDGSFLPLAKEEHFKLAMNGKTNISNRVQDYLDNDNILVEATPVIRNGEIVGALMGTRSTAELAKLLDMQSFGGLGYSLLVRANGDKIVESFHPNAISGLYNIFDIPDDPDHVLRHQVLDDFKSHKSGVVKYHSAKRGILYVSYQPLTINDWYLISVVPEEHVTRVTHSFVTLLPIICLWIALFAGCIGIYLARVWPHLHETLFSPE